MWTRHHQMTPILYKILYIPTIPSIYIFHSLKFPFAQNYLKINFIFGKHKNKTILGKLIEGENK